MLLEFKCPYCGAVMETDVEGAADLACTNCGEVFSDSASSIREAVDNKLLDPADPGASLQTSRRRMIIYDEKKDWNLIKTQKKSFFDGLYNLP